MAGNVEGRATRVLRVVVKMGGTMRTTGGSWEQIDARGLELARKQGELDVEIGEWMLEAREAEVHRHFGFGSFGEYLDRRMGYSFHAAAERLRVAEALVQLGETREALRSGRLTWSAAREITRVAVPETEREWLGVAEGRRASDVEKLVGGRRPGQLPSEPADPRLRRHALHHDVGGETLGLWREAVRRLQQEIDPSLTEEEALREMARRVLGGPTDEGRSPYQVSVSRCEDCGRAWQEARGERVELTPEHVERIGCDAQHVGPVDAASHVGRPMRASQDIAPATRRRVMHRDHGRCRVPGCRNATFLEVHHIQLRSEEGVSDMENLLVLCGAHHQRQHDGSLWIQGTASNAEFRHADGTMYGGPAKNDLVNGVALAFTALRKMGFREGETKRALEVVRSHVGPAARPEEIVRAGLRVLTEGAGIGTAAG